MSFGSPHYTHDCDKCEYLGGMEFEGEYHDLYCCAQGGRPTVIARWGNEGSEYRSGIEFAIDYLLGNRDERSPSILLAEALKRAVDHGHIRLDAKWNHGL